MGMPMNPAMLAMLIERMKMAESMAQPGAMAGLMGGSMGMGGAGVAPAAASGGAGMLGTALPFIGLAGGLFEGIGGAIEGKKNRKLAKDQLKEQKRSNTIQQGATNARLLQDLMAAFQQSSLRG